MTRSTSPHGPCVLLAVVAALGATGCNGCERPDAAAPVEIVRPRRACRPFETAEVVESGVEASATGDGAALFVLTELRFGGEDSGLDLDCIDSPDGCTSEICRDAPPDGRGGVDNRLGPLAQKISSVAGSDLQAEMTQAVESGRHPLLLSITGATGFVDGRARAVEVSFGLDADGDPADLTTGRGRVRADPEAPSKRPARFEHVRIRDGVVTAGPSTDWMPLFWTRGHIAAVPVQEAYLRFRVATPPSGTPPTMGRIADGLIAGAISPAHLSRSILDMDGRTAKVLTRLGPLVRALVRQQSDLDLIAAGPTASSCRRDSDCLAGQSCEREQCVEPGETLDAISFAITFAAVSVVME